MVLARNMINKLRIIVLITVLYLGCTVVLAHEHDVDTNPNEFIFEAKQSFNIPGCGERHEAPTGPTACEQELEVAIKNFEDEKDKLDRKWFEFLLAINDTEQTIEFGNETLAYVTRLQVFDTDLNTFMGTVQTLECTDQVIAFNEKVDEIVTLSEDMPDASHMRRMLSFASYPVSTKMKIKPSATTDQAQEIIITTTPHKNTTLELGQYDIKWNSFIYKVEDIAE